MLLVPCSEPTIDIAARILIIRGQRVLLDQDIAVLYRVGIATEVCVR